MNSSHQPRFQCLTLLAFFIALAAPLPLPSAASSGDTNTSGRASISFQAEVPTTPVKPPEESLIHATRLISSIRIERQQASQFTDLQVRVLQGRLQELVYRLEGVGEIQEVQGQGMLEWGLRRSTNGMRYLVLRMNEPFPTATNLAFRVQSVAALTNTPATWPVLAFAPEHPTFFNGFLRVESSQELESSLVYQTELTAIDPQFFPGPVSSQSTDASRPPLCFRFSGGAYRLTLAIAEADPDLRKVRFVDYRLRGEVHGDIASFVLTGKAMVKHPEGGMLDLLSGAAALTDFHDQPGLRLELEGGLYRMRFLTNGLFPIELAFDARIEEIEGWRRLAFETVSSALRPVILRGLPETTRMQFNAAAQARREQEDFLSFLPATGPMEMRWQEARPAGEGKLFFAVSGTSQVSVSPGLVRQIGLYEYKVMQGELRRLELSLDGEGEVTRVLGQGILSWQVVPPQGAEPRRLIVELNQPQKESYAVTVQTQTPLGAFPLKFKALRITPNYAIRFGGHIRVVNAGAVRLEVLSSPGLAQVSPQRFPSTEALGPLTDKQQAQAFAFRFSGADYDLEIQADNVLPELSVSELLIYHLGETESVLDAELELDVREAPLREFEMLVPAGHSVASLTVPSLSDYTLGTAVSNGAVLLKLQFGQPLSGRQLMQLRLTRSHTSPDTNWVIVPLQPRQAKSVRGFVGLSADPGLRLTEIRSEGLTEMATAFFPKRLKELQLAYRLREEAWAATLQSQRLALSIQVDSLQLFSIGEGIAYGSTVLNYLIAGAPVTTLKLRTATNYANMEFVGRDVRSWKQTDDGYEVYLHSPVSGTYSLMATYDLPFNPREEELGFTGLQPLEVQSDQGYVLMISTLQFQTEPTEVSPGLIPIEPGEIPAEYRLLFDAPLLGAYQFTGRPFQLRLKLSALGQGETVNQVVDRAAFDTRVSAEGQVLTEVSYFLKTQGHSHLRVIIPADTTLWSATVQGEKIVPVIDQQDTLIPLPQTIAPNAVLPVVLKLAAKSESSSRLQVALPRVMAPVLWADWRIQPDEGYRLSFRQGVVTPLERNEGISGFAWFNRLKTIPNGGNVLLKLGGILLLWFVGVLLWRWATRPGMVRFNDKNSTAFLLGAASFLLGAIGLLQVVAFALGHGLHPSPNLAFTIPVQPPGAALEVAFDNREIKRLAGAWLLAWPVYLALVAWVFVLWTSTGFSRVLGLSLGWMLVFWGCLKLPNGAPAALLVFGLFAFIHLILPLWRRQWQLPRKSNPSQDPSTALSAGGTAVLLGFSLFLSPQDVAAAAILSQELPLVVRSVIQSARVEEERVYVHAQIRWDARNGQSLDFLRQPAVLTRIRYPETTLRLVQEKAQDQTVYRLLAECDGFAVIDLDYELVLEQDNNLTGFHLPTRHGLINRLSLKLDQPDLEMASPHVVSIKSQSRPSVGTDTPAGFDLVLAPVSNAWIAWKPRSRDIRAEKAVVYGELFQLHIPTAGIVEGVHEAQIRVAQGQVDQVAFQTPEDMTITDVRAPALAGWKFDPDRRLIRIQFQSPQAKPFAVRLWSQMTTRPLPFTHDIGLLSLIGAAGQISLVAVATGNEVQLDNVTPTGLSVINLEDFPLALLADQPNQLSGLAVRRAFRVGESNAHLAVTASAVQPDVRVVTQQTLSLGEDRTVLGVSLDADITRAGVFKLSFVLPPGLDIESLSGDALSHWTELKTDQERIVTMHLQGKTEGKHSFSLSLVGPGLGSTGTWSAPRLALREASKHTGQLVVVPEQGMRLHVSTREGLTQLDPKSVGVRQQGVLAFRLLQSDWQLGFDVEKVDPWIQVESLQEVTLREGPVKVNAIFEYRIENAGLKSLFLRLPANADGVRFAGEEVADSVSSPAEVAGWNDWEIKLHRRILGVFHLQLSYQIPGAGTNAQEAIAGVQARQVNLHRGYLTVRSGGRLRLSVPSLPSALQSVDWRSLPASLRGRAEGNEGNFTFRAIEPEFALLINVARHQAARLLPARVEKTELTTVFSDAGDMLTQVRLTMQPGDKRSLRLKLPGGARFWFAFVNNTGVWPWREKDQWLIPLEQHFKPGQPVVVEWLYALPGDSAAVRADDFGLLAPEFDLPLENITWQVFLPRDRRLRDWEGTLQLQEQTVAVRPAALDLQSYLRSETVQRQQQTREAESLLQLGNDFLARGEQQQARQAFQSAWSLSQHDDAFNEDARVQLHNLKTQQALVGLNYRRSAAFQDQAAAADGATNTALKLLQANQPPQFTQQDVQRALEGNSAEDNSALLRLAEHLIQQQDAAQVAPDAIRASLPELGNRVTFARSLLVDPWAPLKLDLETKAVSGTLWLSRLGWLTVLFIASAFFILLGRTKQPTT